VNQGITKIFQRQKIKFISTFDESFPANFYWKALVIFYAFFAEFCHKTPKNVKIKLFVSKLLKINHFIKKTTKSYQRNFVDNYV